jgi:hypothetical protein
MTTSMIPRREERHLLPFSSVMLKAELFTPNFCHVGYLWDVSASGACLCFSDSDDEASNIHDKDFLHVRFLSPETEQAITSPCRVAWLNSMHGARFVGVELTEAIDLSKTFFHNLLNPKFLNQLNPI